ncbi:MAG TPA: hypothetical protein ENH01_02960 [Nitrospirae bacterium]|nr:hypothetical protein [Nitrospirota bacterium]
MYRSITILLIATLTFLNHAAAAEERVNLARVPAPAIDDIDPSYYGEWGWHKVHKRAVRNTVKKIQKGSSLPKRGICSKCHENNKYRIFDPHTQLTDSGDIIKEKCLYCHPEKPDEKNATFAGNASDIKFVRNLDVLCLGCHSKQYNDAHPVNANHIRKPSDEMQAMMESSEHQFNIILPLNYKGEIMCATCHNPHERGVIPGEKSAAKGASEKFRVRLIGHIERVAPTKPTKESMVLLTGEIDKICLTCHKNKAQ